MDSRPHQHPFTRPERAPASNSNHQPPQTSQPAGYPSYALPPQASQPQAVHMPFSTESYATSRRDPFLPTAAQHVRSGSYGIHGGEGAQGERHSAWTNTAPGQHATAHPPPPPSVSNQSQYNFDASRRRSPGGTSPPVAYRASYDPPPPPSFARPHMPPPSSPQQQQHSHASQAQRSPFPPAYGGSRELPGLGAPYRPGSSMSISSLIGVGDTGAANQASLSQHSPPTAASAAPPSAHHSMQPPSPRRGQLSGARPDFQPFRRQPSPEKPSYIGGAPRASEVHTYATGSPSRAYSGALGSPEQSRRSLPQSAQPYKPMVFQGARPYGSSIDAHARESQQMSAGIPPRPNSQPTGPLAPSELESRMGYNGRRAINGQPEERRRTLGESHHHRPNVADLFATVAQPVADRERPITVQPLSQSVFSPPGDQRIVPAPHPPPGNAWRHPTSEDPPRETIESRREEQSFLYRGYGGYAAPLQGSASYGAHTAEEMVRGRSLDHLNNRVIEQYHAPPTSDPQSSDRFKAEQLSRSLSSGGGPYGNRSLYDQHARALSALGPEANRRTGRASPLPQAVQGAQAQPVSIGKDPGIKSEFGRMFSGLGSGLGSSTPSRQSPMPQNGPDNFPGDELKLQRVSSQNGRRPKRVKDEEHAFDGESVDGRGTPLARGSKRNKHNHAAHHHHHHAHAHHHHHHHPKLDEDIATHPPSTSSTPFNGRYSQSGVASQSSHHHHHYHAPPHHHHHAPRASQPAPLPSPKISPKVHDVQPVLDEAAKHPRHHLGSYLYEAMPTLPKPNSSLDDQFCYASKPRPLPLFDRDPINCIVTCRVHRYYLKPRQRQQIVLQRHLWGARIYKDNSDPIAAAIHSGWIRGEWDDTVDINMLDPRITAPNDPTDAEDTLTKPPTAPVTPPADMELQIDLLILPRIDTYEGSVEYGISSRKSKTHDGLSYMIQRIRWVEEGVGSRGQEKTAAAMRKRLDAGRALLSLTTGGDDALRAVNGTARLHA